MSKGKLQLDQAGAITLDISLVIIFMVWMTSSSIGYPQYKARTLSPLTAATAPTAIPLLADEIPRFEDYEVPLYRGPIHPPKWIHHGTGGEWRDKLEKLVEPPEINFAGKYFIAVHSCGTGCRYYTLTDLSSDSDLNLLESFTTAEPVPKTRDGHEYMTELFSRPNSRMLVAQYDVDVRREKHQCRERVFLFKDKKLEPITKTRHGCRDF